MSILMPESNCTIAQINNVEMKFEIRIGNKNIIIVPPKGVSAVTLGIRKQKTNNPIPDKTIIKVAKLCQPDNVGIDAFFSDSFLFFGLELKPQKGHSSKASLLYCLPHDEQLIKCAIFFF